MLKNLFLLLAMAVATAAFAQKRGIAIGDDVRVRSSASTKGSILRELERGDVVDVLRISSSYELAGGSETCDKHHWINVKLSDGTTGWVFGQYMQPFDLSDSYGTYTIAGERYSLYVTAYQGYPNSDEEGLTGCSEKSFPILIPTNSPNKGHVLLNKTTYYSENEGYGHLANMHFYKEKYWVLTNDDGWSMELKKEGVESMGTLLLDLRVTGQDTYEGLTVVEISKDSYGRMVAKGVSYQQQGQ